MANEDDWCVGCDEPMSCCECVERAEEQRVVALTVPRPRLSNLARAALDGANGAGVLAEAMRKAVR